MELMAHVTLNEYASLVGIFMLGVGSGLALAWTVLGRWISQDR